VLSFGFIRPGFAGPTAALSDAWSAASCSTAFKSIATPPPNAGSSRW
jgi:hypothetical protein